MIHTLWYTGKLKLPLKFYILRTKVQTLVTKSSSKDLDYGSGGEGHFVPTKKGLFKIELLL